METWAKFTLTFCNNLAKDNQKVWSLPGVEMFRISLSMQCFLESLFCITLNFPHITDAEMKRCLHNITYIVHKHATCYLLLAT